MINTVEAVLPLLRTEEIQNATEGHLGRHAVCLRCVGFALGQQVGPETDVSGNWILSADLFGTTTYLRMELKQDGDKLSGTYTGTS